MAIIEFTIHVENIENVSALYDRIQVFRSPDEDGDPVPYASITSPEPTSAVLDGSIAGPWNLNGQTLSIILNGSDPYPVAFSGTNPFILQDVLEKLNDAFPGFAPNLASEVPTDTGKIRLASPITGTQSIIQVSGTAAATLGLSTTRVNGKAARPLLSSSTEDYLFRDYDGEPTYFYKTRYISEGTGAVSTFSDPIPGGIGTGLPGSSVVTAKVAMATATGEPVIGRRVILIPVSVQVLSDGSGNNYGVMPSVDRIELVTDENGRASVKLVKGQRMKVFLEGTTFQREFVVPTTDFDILTVASTQPDPFNIVEAPPFPIRV